MPKYCECGCGGITKIASRTRTDVGHIKGEHVRFIVGHSGHRSGRAIPIERRFWNLVDKSDPSGCWPWGGYIDSTGYGAVRSGGTTHGAHRVSYELSNGPIPAGTVVRHSCDNPPCVNPAHLLIGSYADNSRDAVIRDRVAHGERVGTAKLSAEKVRAIRDEYASGQTQKALARKYGVSQGSIWNAIHGETWRRVA